MHNDYTAPAGVISYISHIGQCAAPKGRFFAPFWSAYSLLRNEAKRNEIHGEEGKNAYYPKDSLRQH